MEDIINKLSQKDEEYNKAPDVFNHSTSGFFHDKNHASKKKKRRKMKKESRRINRK